MAAQRGTRVSRYAGALLLPTLVVALVVAAALVAWPRGALNSLICDGDCGPDNVVPPRGLTTASVARPPAPASSPRGSVDPDKLAAAVEPALDASVLGDRVGFAAVSPPDGRPLLTIGSGTFTPASTTKVLVGFASLSLLDPQDRFTTKVVRDGDRVVLVGGGDPYLATKVGKADDREVRADLAGLARRAAAALDEAGTTRVSLGYDAGLFTGPAESPAWEPTYVSQNIVTPVSALWADRGVQDGLRAKEPAASAARRFAGLLADRGITVMGEPRKVRAPGTAPTLATARSGTVAQIVETVLRTSDNEAAEILLRHVAIAADRPASFTGGARAVKEALRAADVDTAGLVLHDGSGLSRRNRISPLTLAETVHAAASTPRTSGLSADLPVSGFTGTLVDRFARLDGALGTVRAKTGTLTGVHSLAGYAVDAGGRPVVFAVMSDRSDKAAPFEAQAALDKVAAAIATCRCG